VQEQLISEHLRDLVQIERISTRDNITMVTVRTPCLNRNLLTLIKSRLLPYNLQSDIMSFSTVALNGQTEDVADIMVYSVHHEDSDKLSLVPAMYLSDKPDKEKRWYSGPWMNLMLFIITSIIVFITGSATIVNRSLTDEWIWTIGFQFSIALMAILTAHEFGHYFAARYHGLKVTLPYFLPGILIPPGIMAGFGGTTVMPGTFGAFIRIQSPIQNRKQLLDVGASGPIAGFIVCLIVLIYGFITIPEKEWAYQFYDVSKLQEGDSVLQFGDSILFSLFGSWLAGDRMPAMYDIVHYPLIFAGWFGILVTALNLLPLGQLDGGHVWYALFGKKQKYAGYATFGVIVIMALWLDITSWFLWAILILVLIRIKHPPILDEDTPLDTRRKLIGMVAIIIFILTFMPAPIYEKVLTY